MVVRVLDPVEICLSLSYLSYPLFILCLSFCSLFIFFLYFPFLFHCLSLLLTIDSQKRINWRKREHIISFLVCLVFPCPDGLSCNSYLYLVLSLCFHILLPPGLILRLESLLSDGKYKLNMKEKEDRQRRYQDPAGEYLSSIFSLYLVVFFLLSSFI